MYLRIKSKRAIIRVLRENGWAVKITGGDNILLEVYNKKNPKDWHSYFRIPFGKIVKIRDSNYTPKGCREFSYKRMGSTLPEYFFDDELKTKLHKIMGT
jgi:hypothetical protein